MDSDAKEAELEEALDAEYAALDVEQRLTDALQSTLASHPDDFAPTG